MSCEPKTLEALDYRGCGLRVVFVWHQDRFAHTISAVDGDRLVPLLASHEGSASQPWPVSPPLQSLTIEDRGPDDAVALLVGMAGTSHWSLAVEAHGTPPKLVFDVACRISGRVPQLGSAYRTMFQPQKVAAGDAVQLERHCLLEVQQPARGPKVLLSVTPAGLALTVPLADIAPPATLRWRYQLRCIGAAADR